MKDPVELLTAIPEQPAPKQMTIGGVTFDVKLTFLIIFSTIVPMVDFYYSFFASKAYDRLLLYFVLPMAVIVLLFRESPSHYGFQWGNWKEGLMWTVPICIILGIFLWSFAQTESMQTYYSARSRGGIGRTIWLNGVDLFAWEYIWRGMILFAFARYFGPGPAIFLQAVPFAFMHLGKPELETLSTIFGGAGFGFLAWRTNSFVYGWFIHWFIASLTMLVANGLL